MRARGAIGRGRYNIPKPLPLPYPGNPPSDTPTMNTNWKDTLGAAGAVFDNETVIGFGDAAGELAAASTGTVIAPLSHLGLIRVAGDDARDFLHNQFTSDINHLGPDAVQHSAWCSAKGRMIASFIVWREGDSYLLALARDLLEPVAKRLQMFVLRAKVRIEVAGEAVMLGVAGPLAQDSLAAAGIAAPEPMKSAACAGGSVLRIDAQRCLLALSADAANAAWPTLAANARKVGVPAWQWLDIRAALPVVTAATREHFVPQMANFERIGGVSFHKGCYPGQEIVARTQYLGKVKRHLYRLRAEVPLVAGAELFSPAAPDQSCGMVVVGSASPSGGHEALAVLMESAADAGVHLGALSGPSVSAVPVAA